MGAGICRACSLPLRKLVCAVLAPRNRAGHGDTEEPDEYLDTLLQDENTHPLLDDTTDPELLLRQFSVNIDIE